MQLKSHETAAGLTLSSLVKWSRGTSELSATALRFRVATIVHDSRLAGKGAVFVALTTASNDGHAFVAAALKAGAAAAVVKKKAVLNLGIRDEKKLIRVTDPLKAVQQVALQYRRQLGILMVGVTGSSGKTTTRNFIASVLRQQYAVGETYSNWNNHIGVPLSICRFSGEEWVGVIEMGANHPGEIHTLTKITEPDIAVITNIGYAHIGLFGSLAQTTQAKFEIGDGLNRKNGFYLLNGDDSRLVKEARKRGVNALYFGMAKHCSIRPEAVEVDAQRGVAFTVDGSRFTLTMPGRHFIASALPAIVLGRRCGITDAQIAAALAEQKPVALRGTIEFKHDVRFIVDCYNANPSSMQSALVYLLDIAGKGRKIAVIGDMLELGTYARRLHRELGRSCARGGIHTILAVGSYADAVLDGAREAGMKSRKCIKAATAAAALPMVQAVVQSGDTVLLKGSRGVGLETILSQFVR